MESIKKALPFVLLVSFLALSHYKQAQIADSIIIIALASLCAFSMYLETKKTPNYLEQFKKDLETKDKEIKELQTSLGIYNMSQKRKEQVENIIW
jgi:flagellar motor component MotA